MKIYTLTVELFHADRRRDGHDEDSRNFSNTHKNWSYKGLKRGMRPVIYSVHRHSFSQINV
jgi:hypothetical protein